MIAGLALRGLLGKKLKLLFTSASQREHTWITRMLIQRMDAVVATSEKTARYLERTCEVVYHGIDLTGFAPPSDRGAVRAALGLPRDGQMIGCFGRIRHQKGTDLFVAAAMDLCTRFPDLHAVVVGRATRKDAGFLVELRQRVAAAGLETRILFLDEVPVWEMPDWYRALDVYVAPQRWEGFGLTPLEAMACGVPVVATDVGAFKELIVECDTGFVVEPGAADAISRAVEMLLGDPERLARARAAARSHVERHFDIRQEAEALVRIYRQLIDG